MNGKILRLAGAAILAAGLVWLLQRQGPAGTDTSIPDPEEGAPIVEIALTATLSAEAQIGKRAFAAICADCHGENATGSRRRSTRRPTCAST